MDRLARASSGCPLENIRSGQGIAADRSPLACLALAQNEVSESGSGRISHGPWADQLHPRHQRRDIHEWVMA